MLSEPGLGLGYREFEPLGGHDPYSNSKACSEFVTACFRDSFFQSADSHGLAVASARAGNVIGGGDWAKDRLVPDCVRSWLNSQTVNIRYPHAVRPWQFVLEPLSGYMLLAKDSMNVGKNLPVHGILGRKTQVLSRWKMLSKNWRLFGEPMPNGK